MADIRFRIISGHGPVMIMWVFMSWPTQNMLGPRNNKASPRHDISGPRHNILGPVHNYIEALHNKWGPELDIKLIFCSFSNIFSQYNYSYDVPFSITMDVRIAQYFDTLRCPKYVNHFGAGNCWAWNSRNDVTWSNKCVQKHLCKISSFKSLHVVTSQDTFDVENVVL